MYSVIDLINALRESDSYIDVIYTNGSCYRFFVMVKKLYPDAIPMLNKDMNHIGILLDGKIYDINGEVKEPEDFYYMNEQEIEMVEKWGFFENNYLTLSCPHCGEDVIYA